MWHIFEKSMWCYSMLGMFRQDVQYLKDICDWKRKCHCLNTNYNATAPISSRKIKIKNIKSENKFFYNARPNGFL